MLLLSLLISQTDCEFCRDSAPIFDFLAAKKLQPFYNIWQEDTTNYVENGHINLTDYTPAIRV